MVELNESTGQLSKKPPQCYLMQNSLFLTEDMLFDLLNI
jgi:hypothetical protein